jgi:hypothetical protein
MTKLLLLLMMLPSLHSLGAKQTIRLDAYLLYVLLHLSCLRFFCFFVCCVVFVCSFFSWCMMIFIVCLFFYCVRRGLHEIGIISSTQGIWT